MIPNFRKVQCTTTVKISTPEKYNVQLRPESTTTSTIYPSRSKMYLSTKYCRIHTPLIFHFHSSNPLGAGSRPLFIELAIRTTTTLPCHFDVQSLHSVP